MIQREGDLSYYELTRCVLEATRGAHAPSRIECSKITMSRVIAMMQPHHGLWSKEPRSIHCAYCASAYSGERCPNCGATAKRPAVVNDFRFMGVKFAVTEGVPGRIVFVNDVYPEMTTALTLVEAK